MRPLILPLIYLLFFLSGAAALIYQVVWVRSLSLIFGGTHLAVTTVLAVFMGGLALGSYTIGKYVDNLKNPLRFYGILELGIALFAGVFLLLMKIYPSIYIFLVHEGGNSKLYLTAVRVLFSFLALIIPTTLMGGTLPVLTRFVSSHSQKLGSRLALLYGFNTLGAVFGTAAAGFFLLRYIAVSGTFFTAVALNIGIGLTSILLKYKTLDPFETVEVHAERGPSSPLEQGEKVDSPDLDIKTLFPLKLVLFGIGVSGFCALGYEVLWTRILTLTVGTSVYGFCIMLVAFLTGIALGSKSYGPLRKLFPGERLTSSHLVLWFGLVQCLIGLSALAVTFFIRDLPTNSIQLSKFFQNWGLSLFHARQLGNLTLAFSYMIVPAFFMGLAFPIAGRVNIVFREKIGQAIGTVLAYNTVGAILGSAVSGFVLIYVFGIERSLQLLSIVNIGFGLLILVSLSNKKIINLAVAAATIGALAFFMLSPDALHMWNAKYFAIFQNNQPEAYSSPEKIQEAIENTDVLFFHEGVNSTISSIKIKGGNQAVLVNGKVVASAALKDRQCQLTLGHLPMLFHPNPQKVLVVGLGTGMTLGATSIHPELEELTLAEIEPNVVGAASTFSQYNNHVLDNPKLNMIFNDGRNSLTTKEKYDVITADPIHPWTQGSGYLYTAEYFKLASEHLRPGGIMCQWLPIYELSVDDLKSVVRTFSQNFKYTMTWMTQYDAEIIGSNKPIIINEKELSQRIAHPAISKDLQPVLMATADDFLSYFVMGTAAMQAFGQGAVVNTDDNLYLEYSTPISLGKNLMGINVGVISQYRESIEPYLLPPKKELDRQSQQQKWASLHQAARLADRAHALFLDGGINDPQFRFLMTTLEQDYPLFSPGRFLVLEYQEVTSRIPTLLDKLPLAFLDEQGKRVVIEISAVIARISDERAALMFVDNAARRIFDQRYFSGEDLDRRMGDFSKELFSELEDIYRLESQRAQERSGELPRMGSVLKKVTKAIAAKCESDKI